MTIDTQYIYIGIDQINGDIEFYLQGTLINIFKTAKTTITYCRKLRQRNPTTRFIIRMHPCYISEFQCEIYEIFRED